MQQVKHILINAIACSGTFSRCIGSFGSKRGKECPPSHVRLLVNHNLGRSSPHFLKSAFTQYSLLGVKRGSSNLINYSPFRRDLDLARNLSPYLHNRLLSSHDQEGRAKGLERRQS